MRMYHFENIAVCLLKINSEFDIDIDKYTISPRNTVYSGKNP